MRANDGNPCVVMPTGSGKSHVIAGLCLDALRGWPDTRILILSHVKELLEQDADKIFNAWPEAPLGVYSAGLGKRDLGRSITVAGIQSVRHKAEQLGHIDMVIVDECHLISHKKEGGYRHLIEDLTQINPNLRVIGLTATPYRLGHGLITDEPALFSGLIEPVKIEDLIERGHLAPLRSKLPHTLLSTAGVATRGGEYVESELQKAVNNETDNGYIVQEVLKWGQDRKSWLFFCTGVDHAIAMRDELRSAGVTAETILGNTPKDERAIILQRFKAGEIRAVTNNSVLTTGFDYPGIDLLAMCRPTKSPSLYIQMAGRGMRVKPQGGDCLVLDFAGVVSSHGPITSVAPPRRKGDGTGEAPVKVCEQCQEFCYLSAKVCPACGAPFPEIKKPPVSLHGDDIMGIEPEGIPIETWEWSVHMAKSGIETLKVRYYGPLYMSKIDEYLTVLHGGYAGHRANRTLQNIARQAGADISQAWDIEQLAEVMGNATPPRFIRYKKDGKYYRVVERSWSDPVGA